MSDYGNCRRAKRKNKLLRKLATVLYNMAKRDTLTLVELSAIIALAAEAREEAEK